MLFMNRDEMVSLPIAELLARTQTNITPNAGEGFDIAKVAYDRAETAIEKGTAARQAGFRAEQAGETPQVVQDWFDSSRTALSSDEPQIKRELVATELLTGRAFALRVERMGSKVVELATEADEAFQRGEAILQEQHAKAQPWDRFGTMLARHRATHEAMNGKASFGATTAVRGLWRAVRAEKEGMPEGHKAFVVKQLGMNAAAGLLAVSKPFAWIPKVSSARHQLALKLLG
jgi:hypothetical protein